MLKIMYALHCNFFNENILPLSKKYFLYLFSPLKKLMEGKKTQEKLRWVNSPNVYQKVEVLETGTSDPKKITKVIFF